MSLEKEMLRKIKFVVPIKEEWTIAEVAEKRPPSTWEEAFIKAKPDLDQISEIVKVQESTLGKCFPLRKNIFKAFELTPLNKVKVIILGQDPYPQLNQYTGFPRAQGLSFSVDRTDQIPSSLQNIFKEIKSNYSDFIIPCHGNLTNWARQGVLLLNICLTVQPGKPGSHGSIWMGFVIKMIEAITEVNPECIYLLWGRNAQKIAPNLSGRARVLETSHPSGFSARRGFFGCDHFKTVNEMLSQTGETLINWNLDP